MSDDAGLVASVIRGEERAFSQLYDRHTPALYGLALRLTGGHQPEAMEIVHDAWVRGVEKLATFQGRAALRTWLSAILINRWKEMARAEQRDAGPPIEELSLGREDQALRGTFDRIDLERAVAALPSGRRQVLVLHDVQGYTHEEIGALLGVEPGTSKSQLSRARAELRRALDPRGERP